MVVGPALQSVVPSDITTAATFLAPFSSGRVAVDGATTLTAAAITIILVNATTIHGCVATTPAVIAHQLLSAFLIHTAGNKVNGLAHHRSISAPTPFAITVAATSTIDASITLGAAKYVRLATQTEIITKVHKILHAGQATRWARDPPTRALRTGTGLTILLAIISNAIVIATITPVAVRTQLPSTPTGITSSTRTVLSYIASQPGLEITHRQNPSHDAQKVPAYLTKYPTAPKQQINEQQQRVNAMLAKRIMPRQTTGKTT